MPAPGTPKATWPQRLSNHFRARRLGALVELLERQPKPLSILDVGGTVAFWEHLGLSRREDLAITVLNLVAEFRPDTAIRSVAGDARSMPQYGDHSFDFVFSNSVIEHVGAWEDQVAMAQEVRRIGRRYYLQTPNRHFPIEPHWVFPCFQFLPFRLQVFLTQHLDLGHYRKAVTREAAAARVRSVRLLTLEEFVTLFPEAKLRPEKFFGLTKSFICMEDGTP